MSESTDCILVSSHPKSGTVLVTNIIQFMTKRKSLRLMVNRHFPDLASETGFTDAVDMNCGAIEFLPDNKVKLIFQPKNKDGIIIGAHSIEISNERMSEIIQEDKCYAVEHVTPETFFFNDLAQSFRYKIYVSRDFRDVFNSMSKFVDNSRNVVDIINILKDYKTFQVLRYMNPDFFYFFLNTWGKYTAGYFKHQNDVYLIKYEELVAEPRETLKKLAEYLDTDASDIFIDEIITKFFFKELVRWNINEKTEMCRHYSGGEKRHGEWLDWFNDRMVEATKLEIGEDLIRMGYEKDNNWSAAEPANDEMKLLRQKIDFAYVCYDNRRNMIGEYDSLLSDKKVAVYGAGLYASKFLKLLNRKDSVSFIVDDNPDKYGTKLFGIEICTTDELIKRYMDYDLILIAVHPQYFNKVYLNIIGRGIFAGLIKNAYMNEIDMFE